MLILTPFTSRKDITVRRTYLGVKSGVNGPFGSPRHAPDDLRLLAGDPTLGSARRASADGWGPSAVGLTGGLSSRLRSAAPASAEALASPYSAIVLRSDG